MSDQPTTNGGQGDAGRTLEYPAAGSDVNAQTVIGNVTVAKPSLVGLTVPGYEILGELGRGGMGVVYKARDLALNRLVALKMVLTGMHAGSEEIARFRREAEAVAQLQHVGIVQIYEIGESGALPYLALEYCGGGSLESLLAGTPQPPREAAELMETLARTVQHAHSQGVIHRDLKPANVLLADAMPHAAVPKITDFGLARRIDQGSQTQEGTVLGTPSYMAPEQAQGQTHAVGPSVDVYALGAILYECLTGRPPFKAASPVETVMQVISQDPVPPTRLNPRIPIDLETICLKCLRKEPHGRYASAGELADDLHRFLQGEPIHARPVSAWERGVKWVKRHPAVAALAALSIFLAIVGAAGVAWSWFDAVRERRRADRERASAEQQTEAARQARAQAERNLYFNRIALAEREFLSNNVRRALELLESCPVEYRHWEWHYLRRLGEGGDVLPRAHEAWVNAVGWSADGTRLLSAGDDGLVISWFLDGRAPLTFKAHEGPVRRLVCRRNSDRFTTVDREGNAREWQWVEKQDRPHETKTWERGAAAIREFAYSEDGTLVALADDQGRIRVIEMATEKTLAEWKPEALEIGRMAFSPDGKSLLSTHRHGALLWEPRTGKQLSGHILDRGVVILGAAWSLRQGHLALVGTGGFIHFVNGESGKVNQWKIPVEVLYDVAFSDDGKHLAVAGSDRIVHVWHIEQEKELHSLRGHTDRVSCVAFGLRGMLASGGIDDQVRLWNALEGQEAVVRSGHDDTVFSLALDPRGETAISSDGNKRLLEWQINTASGLKRWQEHEAEISTVAYHPDGGQIATGSWDTTILVHSTKQDEKPIALRGHREKVTCIAYSPDGARLASTSYDRTLRIWNARTGEQLYECTGHTDDIWAVAYHPNGKWIATASWDQTIRLWDAGNGIELRVLREHTGKLLHVAFSGDGRTLASAGMDHTIRLWDVETWKTRAVLRGHADAVYHVAFSPDSERLVSAGADGRLRVWEVESGQLALTLSGHTDIVRCAVFTPDGRRIISAGRDRSVRFWDAGPSTHEGVSTLDETSQRRLDEQVFRLHADSAWRRQTASRLRATALDAAMNDWAARAVQRLEESPERLNDAAWRIVARADRSANEYQEGLRWAEAAHTLLPAEGRFLNTLGVAQYRAGEFPAALRTLQRSIEHDRRRGREESPLDVAFVAMAHYRAKNQPAAQLALLRLRALMKQPTWREDREAKEFLQEAETLLK